MGPARRGRYVSGVNERPSCLRIEKAEYFTFCCDGKPNSLRIKNPRMEKQSTFCKYILCSHLVEPHRRSFRHWQVKRQNGMESYILWNMCADQLRLIHIESKNDNFLWCLSFILWSFLPVSVCSLSRACTRRPKLVFANRKSVWKHKRKMAWGLFLSFQRSL